MATVNNLPRSPAWSKVTADSIEDFDPGVTASTDPVPTDLVVKPDSWNGSHPVGQPNFTGPPVGTGLNGRPIANGNGNDDC